MMKAAVACVVVVCSGTGASAAPGEVRVGLQGGPVFGTFRSVPADEGVRFRNLTLAGAGAVVDVGLDERLALRLEPGYVRKGARLEIARDDFIFRDGVSGTMRVSYVELPALLRVALGGRAVRPYVLAGPTAAWREGARIRVESGGVAVDEDAEDRFEALDIGITAGAGVGVPAGGASVLLEGRYTLGLWNIATGAVQDKLKTRAFQVAMGVTFGASRRSEDRPPGRARAQERRGFWASFGLGHGLGKTTCEGVVLGGVVDIDLCDRSGEREGGATGSLALGGSIGSRLLLGAELTAWSGFTSPTGLETFSRDTLLTNLLATVQVYPFASTGWFLKGGAGLASHTLKTEARRRRHGLGLGLGLGTGYDVRIGRNVSLTPMVGYHHGAVGETPEVPELFALSNVEQGWWDLSLGLTLH